MIFKHAPFLYQNLKDLNYLEIGLSSGGMFKFLKEKVKTAYGVDPAPWSIGVDDNVVPDISLIPPDIKFDIIVACDVLEHLADPVDMIKKLNKLGRDNSIFYCTFPNKDCFKAKLMKGKWGMILPLGHLHYFSSKSIKNAFELNGWKIITIERRRMGDYGVLDVIRNFDYKIQNLPFRLIKSLLLGQIFLGRDQWGVWASKSF